MIRTLFVFMAAAAPAAAQTTPVTFEFGKSLSLAAGQWNYVATQGGGESRYGTHLALVCDRANRIVTISRPGAPVASLTIITDTQTKAVTPDGRLSAYDPILDAVAFSRGRFLVAGGSATALAVPSWPEAARSIEDCRN